MQNINELFTILRPKLIGYLKGFIQRNHRLYDEIEDIANEAFLNAYKYRDQFRSESNVKTWIFEIARNEFFDRNKQCKRIVESSIVVDEDEINVLDVISDGHTPESYVLDKERLEIAVAAFEELPIKTQEILALWMDGFEYPEIGEKLGIAKCTVGTRINRAKELMKNHIMR